MESKRNLIERQDLVQRRWSYLRTIKQKRKEGYKIIYLDETWVNASHTASYQWQPEDPSQGWRIPTGRGQRLILLHAGGDMGFLPGCELLFRSKSTDGRDYHTEMNSTVFIDWTKKQLIPALPQKSLVVMDNASYHNVVIKGTRPPTSATRKAEIQQWLTLNDIQYDSKLTKPKLLKLVMQNKSTPKYQVDSLLAEHGHGVLRLPPYHCDFKPHRTHLGRC